MAALSSYNQQITGACWAAPPTDIELQAQKLVYEAQHLLLGQMETDREGLFPDD